MYKYTTEKTVQGIDIDVDMGISSEEKASCCNSYNEREETRSTRATWDICVVSGGWGGCNYAVRFFALLLSSNFSPTL